MSYRDMQKRLEQLESTREQQERAEHQAWVESLSDTELDAWCADYAERDSVGYATFEALSEEDLDRACDGRMSDAEWQAHRRQAQEQRSVI